MVNLEKSRKEPTGRGSPEAVAKRRAARELNSILSDGGARLDGRAERRRRRLLEELKKGRGGIPLKPIDFVGHIDELLHLGETLVSLKKHGIKPRATPSSPEVLQAVQRTQRAYGFDPSAWRMLGVDIARSSTARGKHGRRNATKG